MNKLLTKSLRLTRKIQQCSSGFSTKTDIKKSVFISQSNDVFTNLALEDWFYKNNDFSQHHILMLWQNEPCVVIGRHQNPWEEVNISKLEDSKINLARRNSGGGTVYHDNGNLNLTFFTSRKNYNRKYNLELIAQAISKEFGLNLTISPKFDILFKNHKVSFYNIMVRFSFWK